MLPKAEHILHAVEAGRLADDPPRRAQGAGSEGLAAGSFVRQFEPFALAGEDHGVISDNIAAANRVNPNLGVRPLADHSRAAMREILAGIEVSRIAQNFSQSLRCPARRVLFQPVMDLDNLGIEIVAQQLRRFSGQPKRGHSRRH